MSSGMSAFVSALNVSYRDFRYVVPFMMQLWMLATPAIYARAALPGRWRWLETVNPVNALVAGWRSCILDEPLDWAAVGACALVVGAALVAALAYFRHSERGFADII